MLKVEVVVLLVFDVDYRMASWFEHRRLLLVLVAAEFLSVFRDCRHRPVAADGVRKKLLLAEVPVGSAGATVVYVVAEVALMCLVVVLVVAVDVAAVEAVVPDPWEYIP
jgi:hypothetical protein